MKKKKLCRKKERKKCYALSFPILGGRDSTRALQPSPFQKYENLKKSQKSLKKKEKKFEEKKMAEKKEKKNDVLLVFQH